MRKVLALLGLLSLGVAEVPLIVAVDESEPVTDSDLENSCSLGCAVGWQIKSSSSGQSTNAELADDDLTKTAWVAGGTNLGVGEWLEFSFPKERFGKLESVKFRGFRISAGDNRDNKAWRAHARPKTLRVVVDGDAIADVSLLDTRNGQRLSLPAREIRPGSVIRVEIREVFPGASGLPVAISALRPQGAH